MTSSERYVVKDANSQAEMDLLFEIVWLAEHHPYEPFVSICFPVFGATEADRQATISDASKRLWKEHLANPASHWIYVEDTVTGQVVATTQWEVHERNPFPNGPPKLEAYWWPEGEGREFCSSIFNQVFMPRSHWVQRPNLALNHMSVHPKHRLRGLAGMMMEWGVKRADELGVESLIEASPMGRWVYEKYGWRVIAKIAYTTAKKEPSDQWLRYEHELTPTTPHIMWRPKGGIWAEDGKQKMPWEMGAED